MALASAHPVARFFDEVCNSEILDVAGDLFAPTHILHDPAHPAVEPGPAGIKSIIGLYQRAFPDGKWRVEEIIDAGDTVVARWTATGTHRGELMGIAPTGRTVAVPGTWIFRISEARIVESWNAWDALGLIQQLDALQAAMRTGRGG